MFAALVIYAFVITVMILFIMGRITPRTYYLIFLTWSIFWSVTHFISGDWPGGIFQAVFVAFWLWMLWRIGPRGRWKKVKKAVGAKARALKAKLVSAMPKPSTVPVLKPVMVPG